MGKVCYINGFPYLVSLPIGGKSQGDQNPWDEMIDFLGDHSDDVFHWKDMSSWCQDAINGTYSTIRGGESARYWNGSRVSSRGGDTGFRPVLTPLNSKTLKPDPSLLSYIKDGSKFALMSMYINMKPVRNPQKPTWNGDIAEYNAGREISFGNRDCNPRNWIYVIKFKDLLWTDRNVLKNISWEQLKTRGFVE